MSERVSEMIAAMDVGEWEIVECKPWLIDSIDGQYTVFVAAQPVYDGITVTRQSELDWQTIERRGNWEYALNYNQESMEFIMSNDGRLIEYTYKAPLQVVDVVEDAAEVLSFDELENVISAQFPSVVKLEKAAMEASVILDISDEQAKEFFTSRYEYVLSVMEIGYFRVNMDYGITDWTAANESDGFYLIPAVMLRGYTIYHYRDGYSIFGPWDLRPPYRIEDTKLRFIINLLDGSVLYPAS